MRSLAAFLALAAVSLGASANAVSQSYWLLSRGEGGTWCGYSKYSEFAAEAARARPTESARVTYSSNHLAELAYQIEPESGDWVVIDKYSVAVGKVTLRRENLLTQRGLKVIESTTIRGGQERPLRIVGVATLEGRRAEAPPKLDLPRVPVQADPSRMPFMALVTEMRSRSIASLCKKLD